MFYANTADTKQQFCQHIHDAANEICTTSAVFKPSKPCSDIMLTHIHSREGLEASELKMHFKKMPVHYTPLYLFNFYPF
jgi:hypothetical protein